MKLIFIGPPGAGKGTQAAMVLEKTGICHISTGAMLRQAIADGTELGLQAKALMDAGKLVGDDVVIGIVRERIAQPDCSKGFLLDGFPRTIPQAEALDTFTEIDAVVNVDVPNEHILKRITSRRMCRGCGKIYSVDSLQGAGQCPACGGELYLRDDDREEAVAVRLQAYEQQTKPLADYYAAQGKLYNIDGNRPVDVVFQDIMNTLEKL